MKKVLKIFTIVLFVPVFLVAIALLALLVLVDPNDYKPQLQALAATQQVELHLDGDLRWEFFPQFGIQTGQFSIKPPVQRISRPLRFDNLSGSVQLLPLLQRRIVINTITLRSKEIIVHDDIAGSDITINDFFLEAHKLNLDEQAFPLSLSLNISTDGMPASAHLNVDTQIAIDRAMTRIAFNPLSLQLDNTQAHGSLHATLKDKTFFTVTLAGTQLDLDRYLTPTAHANTHANDKNEDEATLPIGAVVALPGEYHITFNDVVLQHLHMAPFDLAMEVSPQRQLTLKQLKAGVYSGELLLQGHIDAQTADPDITATLTLNNLSLAPALRDYYQVEKTLIWGDVSLVSSLSTQGAHYKQMLSALAGEFSVNSPNIILDQVNLLSTLDASLLETLQIKLPNLISLEHQTAIHDVAAKGSIAQGVLSNSYLNAAGLCMQIDSAGTYNLVNADVDYYLDITFPSAAADKPCADINPRLKDIPWPMLCKGSLGDGIANICSADRSEIQLLVLKSVGKGVNNRVENLRSNLRGSLP